MIVGSLLVVGTPVVGSLIFGSPVVGLLVVGSPVVGSLVGLDAGADDGFAVGRPVDGFPVGRRVDGFPVDGFPIGLRVDGFLVVGLGDVGFDVEGRCVDGFPVVGLGDVGFEVVAKNVVFDDVGKNVGTFDLGDEGRHVKLVCVALRCRYAFAIR